MIRNLVTAEELAAIERVNNDCMKLHVCPPPVTFVDMEVRDANGELVDGFTMKSNSWVRNAYNTLFSQMCGIKSASGGTSFGAGSLPLKSATGTVQQSTAFAARMTKTTPAIGVDTNGIVVGASNAAESFEHYILTNAIANGTASGQLTYGAESDPSFSYDSPTKKATSVRTRIFNNNSGSAIVVKEVGLFLIGGNEGSTANILISRDALASAVSVPNGGQLTVTYTIEMTFPA